MLTAAIALIAGLAILAWSAHRLVYAAATTARNLGVPPVVIGLTIIGFGTSAPELFVSVSAALHGNASIALGNALGSNIANVGLVIGITAIVLPFSFRSRILRREVPIMFLAIALTILLLWDHTLGRVDGMILLAVLVATTAWSIIMGSRQTRAIPRTSHGGDALGEEIAHVLVSRTGAALTSIVINLVLLIASSRLLVWGTVVIARQWGISDLMIGLTILAVGTSLPEIATAIASTLRRQGDIAVGNVVGSNIFNMLGVLGAAALISPIDAEACVLTRDFPVMLGLAALMFVFAPHIRRWQGAMLVGGCLAYLTMLGAGLMSA